MPTRTCRSAVATQRCQTFPSTGGSNVAPPNKGWTCAVPQKKLQTLLFYGMRTRYWSGAMLNKDFDLDAGVVVYVSGRPSDLGYTIANVWDITRDQGALQPYVAIHLPDVTSP